MVISDGIPAVPRNRKPRNSVPNPSAEEKTTGNSIPENKTRSKLSEFLSEPFRGREKTFIYQNDQGDEMEGLEMEGEVGDDLNEESLEREGVKELYTLFQPK
jgi:hypothetical protein